MSHLEKIYCEKLQTQRKKFCRRKTTAAPKNLRLRHKKFIFLRAQIFMPQKSFYISSVEPVSEVSAAGFFSSCFAPSAPISASSCSPVSNIARSSSSCSLTP